MKKTIADIRRWLDKKGLVDYEKLWWIPLTISILALLISILKPILAKTI